MQRLETSAEQADTAERTRLTSTLAALTETASRITIRQLATGAEREVDTGARRKTAVRLAADNLVLFTGSEEGGVEQVFVAQDGRSPVAVTSGEPAKVLQEVNSTGTAVLFTHRAQGRRGGGTGLTAGFGIISLPASTATVISGTAPAFSGDGRTLTYVSRLDPDTQLLVAPVATPDRPTVVRTGGPRLDAPALSSDGSSRRLSDDDGSDWELYVAPSDGTGERRLTREIQHDLSPRFLGDGTDSWPDRRGAAPAIVPLRCGIGPAHAAVPQQHRPDDRARIRVGAEPRRHEGADRRRTRRRHGVARARRLPHGSHDARSRATSCAPGCRRISQRRRPCAPKASGCSRRSRRAVTAVVADASTSRVFGYEQALFDFDSKHITRPGNKLASSYLFDTYKSFGYAPEYQWFPRSEAAGGQTANVIATLKGTVNPELVYVVSSHYDSVATGPGADDDSSGTAALLETARMLAGHPQPATIVFASFTGEESGLLGSREFVRRAVADKMRIVGALNNDMVGWANDHRLDNTIRYSNPGIRDIQHAAAMQFSNLITYDALYYKGTDAHAYYEAYGDIVGGIGSYPVLGSPHYHQPHDTLDTINHQLVTEVAKTTAATLMLLASSPSRLADLKVDSYQNGTATLSWTPSPEQGRHRIHRRRGARIRSQKRSRSACRSRPRRSRSRPGRRCR